MNVMRIRIALRADASAQSGIGHVQRSLALGQALRACGAEVCLVTRRLDVNTAALTTVTQIDRIELASPAKPASIQSDVAMPIASEWPGWNVDATETINALRQWHPDVVVADHYCIDTSWHREVAAGLGARLAAIDDLADRQLDVDWLIDHNQSADHRAKYAGHLRPDTKLLCGPRYALLAPTYATAARYQFRPNVASIGIFLGGTDPAGLSFDALVACRDVAGFAGNIEVVTTRANPRLNELATTCRRWPSTTLTLDAPNLAAFFARHDLQIGAGGGASWERCCIGAPTLALVGASNQRLVVSELLRLGVVAALPSVESPTCTSIGLTVSRLLRSAEHRAELALRSQKLVDGLGARRVALHLASSMLSLRNVTAGDAALIHRWRNDAATRAMSHDGEEIEWETHQLWLADVLADPSRLLLIASIGDIQIGVIRFDRQSGGAAVVSLFLDPTLHGLGLGSAMLLAGERKACGQASCPTGFEATVIGGNTNSLRLFQSAGYRQDGARWTKTVPCTSQGETTP